MKTLTTLILILTFQITSAQYTSVPDQNFEQWLIDGAYKAPPIEGRVETKLIKNISTVNVAGKNITDFTGIEDFEKLRTFSSTGSKNITKLDLSNNVQLQNFRCNDCSFSSLDFSTNVSLETVECERCQLTEIILPKNQTIANLYLAKNNLAALEVGGMEYLRFLNCDSNQIESLDLTKNTKIGSFTGQSNKLKTLKIRNPPSGVGMTSFHALGNPDLNCVELTDSNTFNHFKNMQFQLDPGASFEINCNYDKPNTVGNGEMNGFNIHVYPNPNFGTIHIDGKHLEGSQIQLHSLDGRMVFSTLVENDQNEFELIEKAGLYFLKIVTPDGKEITQKIILQ